MDTEEEEDNERQVNYLHSSQPRQTTKQIPLNKINFSKGNYGSSAVGNYQAASSSGTGAISGKSTKLLNQNKLSKHQLGQQTLSK